MQLADPWAGRRDRFAPAGNTGGILGTHIKYRELVGLIQDGEAEKETFRGRFKDWRSDRFISEDVDYYEDDIDAYHRAIIDKKNTTIDQLNRIFDDVYTVEDEFCQKYRVHCEKVGELERAYGALADMLHPNPPDGGGFMLGRPSAEFQSHLPKVMTLLRWKAMLIRLTEDELIALDIGLCTPEERAAYFREIYRRLLDTTLNSDTVEKLRGLLDRMTPEDSMSLVYDTDGNYGGDQGSPKSRFLNDTEFQNYMYALLPGMTEDEIKAYLMKYSDVGCSYMAMANTIFVEYANRPDEFERIFGFPMYDANGRFNFDFLALDIYSNSGNEGKGTLPRSQKKIFDRYLESKGVPGSVTNKKYDVGTIEEALMNGHQVILEQKPVLLYNMDGTPRKPDKHGHSVIVTGVMGDGTLIVSSWGKQYLVRPDDYKDRTDGYFDYEVVTYG